MMASLVTVGPVPPIPEIVEMNEVLSEKSLVAKELETKQVEDP